MKALLLSPVMVLKKPAFAWDFYRLTGEFFSFANAATGSALQLSQRIAGRHAKNGFGLSVRYVLDRKGMRVRA
jgi:hypothetical protein